MDSRQKSWIESNGPVSNSWISDPHCTNVWNQVISLIIQLGLQGLFLPHFNGVRTEQILLVFVTSLSYLLILKLFLLLCFFRLALWSFHSKSSIERTSRKRIGQT